MIVVICFWITVATIPFIVFFAVDTERTLRKNQRTMKEIFEIQRETAEKRREAARLWAEAEDIYRSH